MNSPRIRSVEPTPPRPLLIYDGDCGFCLRYVEYWRTRTGNRIDYEPSQTAADRFPALPRAGFERAVYLIEPDGRVTHAAHAVFRLLAIGADLRGWLWIYDHVPGFAPLAEMGYRFVARFRGGLAGNAQSCSIAADSHGSGDRATRWLFLRFLAVIYFIAFASLSVQIVGLVGRNGILPATDFLTVVRDQIGADRFRQYPTLFWFGASDMALQGMCYGGMTLSLLLFADLAPALMLVLLWLGYLSLATVCRDFLFFQWDNLLLETGLLAIFVAPMRILPRIAGDPPPHRAAVRLLRWLAFRLMFASGVVKLTSGDPTWRDLTALTFHYQTQPIPIWTGWWMHHLPAALHKASAIGMFTIELVAPWGLFAPRRVRHVCALMMIALQMVIGATGNYGFFNLLAIALCLTLLSDSFWPRRFVARFTTLPTSKGGVVRRWSTRMFAPVATAFFVLSFIPFSHAFRPQLPEIQSVYRWFYGWAEPFRSMSSYGLFAVMTTTRTEIVIEGSRDGREWRTYEFRYKPGDLSRPPPFIGPHMPRLDWQMWFAALGDYRSSRNQWFMRFAEKLLGGSKDVLALLAKNPFPGEPPHYIRATLYDYRFTTAEERRATRHWWARTKLGPYCPVLSFRRESNR